MTSLAVMMLAIVLACAPTTAQAQSFAAGFTRYQKGDFTGAEQAFKAALPNTADGATKAKIYKFLGISQFMNGDKAAAEASFRDALQQSPGIAIKPSEVLDESVIPVLEGQRAAVSAAAPAPAAETVPVAAPPAAPEPLTAAVVPTDPTIAPPAPKAPGKKPLKKTLLRVTSNVSGGSVMIGGIVAGDVNTSIDADPGVIDIEVMAPGFQTRKAKVRIVQDQETAVRVDLEKDKPKKAEKKKRKKPIRRARAAGDDMFSEAPPPRATRKRTPRARAVPGAVAEFENDAAYAAPQPQPYVYSPAAPLQRRAQRPPADDANSPGVAMLPFGAGQFQDGRNVLGGVLALTQVGALYFAYSEYSKSNAATAERDALIEQRAAEEQELSSDEVNYVNDLSQYAKTGKQNAVYGGAAFFGLWVAGAVDALLHDREALLKQSPRQPMQRPAGYYGSLAPTLNGSVILAIRTSF